MAPHVKQGEAAVGRSALAVQAGGVSATAHGGLRNHLGKSGTPVHETAAQRC